MTYKLYLYVLTQLATRRIVVFAAGDHQIVFQLDEEKGDWKFFLKLTSLKKEGMTNAIKECFSFRNSFFFSPDTHLAIEHIQGPGIYLIKTLKPSRKYLLFKQLIEDLLQEADDFKDLLCLQ